MSSIEYFKIFKLCEIQKKNNKTDKWYISGFRNFIDSQGVEIKNALNICTQTYESFRLKLPFLLCSYYMPQEMKKYLLCEDLLLSSQPEYQNDTVNLSSFIKYKFENEYFNIEYTLIVAIWNFVPDNELHTDRWKMSFFYAPSDHYIFETSIVYELKYEKIVYFGRLMQLCIDENNSKKPPPMYPNKFVTMSWTTRESRRESLLKLVV